MNGRSVRQCLLASLLVSGLGCSRSSVEGEAYLRGYRGDPMPMAAMMVYFVPGERGDSLMRRVIALSHTSEHADSGTPNLEVMQAVIDSIKAAKHTAATDSVVADIKGHYRLTGLPAGRGYVWADACIDGRTYSWTRSVDVPQFSALRLDLDNAHAVSGDGCAL